MVVAVSKAVEEGASAIICASTGNTSASAAAYAAAAGIDAVVVLPRGQIALGKLLQALVAGARVVAIDGNFDQALAIVGRSPSRTTTRSRWSTRSTRTASRAADRGVRSLRRPWTRAGHPRDPRRQRGQHQRVLGGFRDYVRGPHQLRATDVGFQAAGAAPLVTGQRVDHPETVATAIRIGDPASGTTALAARDESGGVIEAVTDDEIPAAYRDLARLEGIFCEPSSAAGVAGVRRAATTGGSNPMPSSCAC